VTPDTSPQPSPPRGLLLRLLSDQRVLQLLGQVAFVAAALFIIWSLGSTAADQMRARGLVPTFGYLEARAGFAISESPEWYSSDSTYGEAFAVGMLNTLRIVVIGLIMATLLGLFVGVFLLSSNWLVSNIARAYVELLRNTPLLVQLFAWYFIVMFSLPRIQQAIVLPGEGVTFITLRLALWLLLALALWRYLRSPAADFARREALRYGFAALVLVTELAAWSHFERDGGLFPWGAGLSLALLLWSGLGLALFFVARRRLPPQTPWRPRALGLITGQGLALLLFSLGLLPLASLRLETEPAIFVSIRGLVFPEVLATARFAAWFAYLGLGCLLAGFIWIWLGRRTEETGRPYARGTLVLLALLLPALLGWALVSQAPAPAHVAVERDGEVILQPLAEAEAAGLLDTDARLRSSAQPLLLQMPTQNRFGRFLTGTELTPEYAALLVALVIYTSAFIAEIVRAGIQAVPHGQLEAGRALGLSQAQLLERVVLPQALRVIIPPLGNQYLNLAKNSSLALGIGFPDTFQVSYTIMNQSGQTITAFLMVMLFYLSMSLTISVVMNALNRRFRLVTR